jgi:hypothetical protein
MRPRLLPAWRRELNQVQTTDLVFVTDLDLGKKENRKALKPAESSTRPSRPPQSPEKKAYHKTLAENLVEDDPLGPDSKEGSPNFSQAFDLKRLRQKRLSQALAVIISKVAEDLSGRLLDGDDEWDMEAVLMRRLNRRSLGKCRCSRERISVVLILDTSGSCLPQARFYSHLAESAIRAGDVELYAAPNAGLIARRTPRGWIGLDDPHWRFTGRTIIFFGDFDGGDAVVEAGWSNKLYWFCSEGGRYPSMREHPWCSYPMSRFKGRFFQCDTEEDFLDLWRKVR